MILTKVTLNADSRIGNIWFIIVVKVVFKCYWRLLIIILVKKILGLGFSIMILVKITLK